MTDQKPIARVTGYHGGHCIVVPTDSARLLQMNMALYAAAQPADPAPHRDALSGNLIRNVKPSYVIENKLVVPTVLIEFKPIPADSDSTSVWDARDSLAAAIRTSDSNTQSEREAFEESALKHGGLSLESAEAHGHTCANNWFPATYRDPMTEIAWRMWANKLSRTSDRDAIRDAALEEAAKACWNPGPDCRSAWDRGLGEFAEGCESAHKADAASIRALQSGGEK